MFVVCLLVGYFLQCGPHNTMVVALFTQGGVGVVSLQARQGGVRTPKSIEACLLIFLHRHMLSHVFACHFCGICASVDYDDQLAP